jgi:hypothetical protein
MDSGIWATWYDIEPQAREQFLHWAHQEYLPFLRSQPGIAWVAHYRNDGGGQSMRKLGAALARPDMDVARGGQYLLLVGATSPHVFFNPLVTRMAMPAGFAEFLALRCETVTNIFVEAARVNGPSSCEDTEGGLPGPAIQMGSFRIKTPEAEFDLGEWYAQNRFRHMARMPACIRTRKLVSIAGWAKHAVLYEFTSLESRLEQFEEPLETEALDATRWTGKVVGTTIHIPGSPVIGPRIWPQTRKA